MKKTLALMLLLAGLTMNAQAETLIWNGFEDHMTWNFEDDNWLTTDESPSQYKDSCDLVFGDTGSGAVALDGEFAPDSVTLNSSKDYTITGEGKLTGSMQLTKEGSCSLTINTANNYTGGTLIKGGTLVLGCELAIEGSVTIAGGTLVLGSDRALGFPNVTLEGGTLDLGGNTIYSGASHFILKGNTNSIGNGTFYDVLTVPDDSTLTLCGDLGGKFPIILSGGSTLNLGGHTLTKRLDAREHTTISHGKIVLDEDLLGAVLEDVTLDLNGHTYRCTSESLKGSCSIGNGTIRSYDHSLCVEGDSTLTLFGITSIDGVTITAGQTQVQSLVNATPGLLKELSVSDGLIAGTDRQSSLADGLKIESEANLMIKSMTITANNSISVGENIITLQDVTIDLSAATYELLENVYWFDLTGLFHCEVDMERVTLDASFLPLPEGLDPVTVGVAFKFEEAGEGTDGVSLAGKNLYVNIGDRWSYTSEIQGNKLLFTNLVPTPEPATGTLSLLALAALAARRRRRK